MSAMRHTAAESRVEGVAVRLPLDRFPTRLLLCCAAPLCARSVGGNVLKAGCPYQAQGEPSGYYGDLMVSGIVPVSCKVLELHSYLILGTP